MERILKAFKDLYKCEGAVKRHWLYVLLLLIPAILGGFASWVDKETPKEALPLILAFVALFVFLSIVPGLMSLGFTICFNKDRLNGVTGIPKVNLDMFVIGIKTLPLSFVWSIYFLIFAALFVFAPIFLAIVTGMSLGNNISGIICVMLLTLLFVTAGFILFLMIAPFLNYIIFRFSKDLVYRAEYFNPFVLVGFIKKAFKRTMLVMLKMLLASMVVSSVAQILAMIFVLFAMVFPIIAALFAPTEATAETAAFSPTVIFLTLPFTTIAALIQAYTTSMVTFAATDMYVEVYKTEIEPTE